MFYIKKDNNLPINNDLHISCEIQGLQKKSPLTSKNKTLNFGVPQTLDEPTFEVLSPSFVKKKEICGSTLKKSGNSSGI